MRSMYYPKKPFSESISQINSINGNFQIITKKLIQPKISVIAKPNTGLNYTTEFSLIFEGLLTNVVDFYKKVVLFGIAEEIAKHINDTLKLKMSQDVYLSGVVVQSLVDVKKYLNKIGKNHELNAFVWNDIEDPGWEENIISVKIECKDNKEKRKIWDDIDEIVRKHENKEIIVLTHVDRYEV